MLYPKETEKENVILHEIESIFQSDMHWMFEGIFRLLRVRAEVSEK